MHQQIIKMTENIQLNKLSLSSLVKKKENEAADTKFICSQYALSLHVSVFSLDCLILTLILNICFLFDHPLSHYIICFQLCFYVNRMKRMKSLKNN